MAVPPFTVGRFTTRWFFSAFMTFGTYNPSGHSYFHWVTTADADRLSLKVCVGVALAWWYIHLWPIMWTTLGPYGLGAAVAILATFSLTMWDFGLMDHIRPSFYVYGLLLGLSTVIAVGLGWSHFQLAGWYMKNYRKVTPKRVPTYRPPAVPLVPPAFPGAAPPPPLI